MVSTTLWLPPHPHRFEGKEIRIVSTRTQAKSCWMWNDHPLVSLCGKVGWRRHERLTCCTCSLGLAQVRRGFRWKLIHDPEFESARNRAKRGLDILEHSLDEKTFPEIRRMYLFFSTLLCREEDAKTHAMSLSPRKLEVLLNNCPW